GATSAPLKQPGPKWRSARSHVQRLHDEHLDRDHDRRGHRRRGRLLRRAARLHLRRPRHPQRRVRGRGRGAPATGASGPRARHDVATALILVLMLGIGALFISLGSQYAQETYSLLFGEVFGISPDVLLPIGILGLLSVLALLVIFRPLMLTSAMPEVAEARGVRPQRIELVFLLVMALATSMTVPVVGALLMFSLMIGPAAAARSFTARP